VISLKQESRWGRLFVGTIVSPLILILSANEAFADSARIATKLYSRLASAPLSLSDTKRTQMVSLIDQGKLLEAAQIATQDDRFYNITVRAWATSMSNRAEDPVVAQGTGTTTYFLNDFVAMVIGTVRDNRNAQELLNGDFTYYVTDSVAGLSPYKPLILANSDTSNSKHFFDLHNLGANLRQSLVRVSPQKADFTDSAGVITSQAWGAEHFAGGTNRRPLQYALKEFLCVDIDDVRDPSLPTTRIRRDVSRTPGGSATTFETNCRACHTGMDGLAGAFANYNTVYYSPETLLQYASPVGYFSGTQLARVPNTLNPTPANNGVVSKMNQNGSTFPTGYYTTDDSWINYFASSASSTNLAIGWPADLTAGKGIRSLGTMLANTKAFPRCMTKRVFRKLCGRNPTSAEAPLIQSHADQFVAGGYNLKTLFEKIAIEATCIGR
jgi:hypothetical protein